MTRERDGWILLLVLLAMLGLMLCLARPAHAQVTIADQIVARQKAVIGTLTASSSPLTVVGLPGSGDILRVGAGGSVGIGPLVVADIPSDFTRRNANEAISGFWTFGSGSLSFTNATSNFLIWPSAGVNTPTLTTRSVGTRIVWFPSISASGFDYAAGLSSGTIWTSVQTTGDRFAWFASDNDSNAEPADQDLVAELTGLRDFLPGMTYTGRLGLANRKWGELNAATLRVETLVAQDVIATVGGRVLVGPTNSLMTAIAVGSIVDPPVPACFRYNNFAVNDAIYFEAAGAVEFMVVTADDGACTAPNGIAGRQYRLQRDLPNGGTHKAWEPGAAAFNTGQVGNGFMDLYALAGIRTKAGITTTELGPTIVGNVRTVAGTTSATGWAPRWAVGNLSGLYGYTSTTYGSAFGDPSTTFVAMDATNGFRVMNGGTAIGQWDTAGVVTIGPASSSTTGKMVIDSDSVDVWYRGSNLFSIYSSSGASLASFSTPLWVNSGLQTPTINWGSSNLTISTTPFFSHIILQPGASAPVSGTVQPAFDAATPLGSPSKRWNNIFLYLPVQTGYGGVGSSTTPASNFPYVVTGDRGDATLSRLGYYCGVTGGLLMTVPTSMCGSGIILLEWQCGITTKMACS